MLQWLRTSETPALCFLKANSSSNKTELAATRIQIMTTFSKYCVRCQESYIQRILPFDIQCKPTVFVNILQCSRLSVARYTGLEHDNRTRSKYYHVPRLLYDVRNDLAVFVYTTEHVRVRARSSQILDSLGLDLLASRLY